LKDREENYSLQDQSLLDLLTPEKNPLMNHNKEARDELQAFVDVIKTIRRVRYQKELECHLENLMMDIKPFIKDSKQIYYQAMSKSGNAHYNFTDSSPSPSQKIFCWTTNMVQQVCISKLQIQELNRILKYNKMMFLSREMINKKFQNIYEEFKKELKPENVKTRFGCMMWKFAKDRLNKTHFLGEYLEKIQEYIITKILTIGVNDMDKEVHEGAKNLIKEIIRREKNLADIFELEKKVTKRRKKQVSPKNTKRSKSGSKQGRRHSAQLKGKNFVLQKNLKKSNYTDKVSNKIKNKKSGNALKEEIKTADDFFQEMGISNNKKSSLSVESKSISVQKRRSELSKGKKKRPKKPPILSRNSSKGRRSENYGSIDSLSTSQEKQLNISILSHEESVKTNSKVGNNNTISIKDLERSELSKGSEVINLIESKSNDQIKILKSRSSIEDDILRISDQETPKAHRNSKRITFGTKSLILSSNQLGIESRDEVNDMKNSLFSFRNINVLSRNNSRNQFNKSDDSVFIQDMIQEQSKESNLNKADVETPSRFRKKKSDDELPQLSKKKQSRDTLKQSMGTGKKKVHESGEIGSGEYYYSNSEGQSFEDSKNENFMSTKELEKDQILKSIRKKHKK
jgi:hypothetical protein